MHSIYRKSGYIYAMKEMHAIDRIHEVYLCNEEIQSINNKTRYTYAIKKCPHYIVKTGYIYAMKECTQ